MFGTGIVVRRGYSCAALLYVGQTDQSSIPLMTNIPQNLNNSISENPAEDTTVNLLEPNNAQQPFVQHFTRDFKKKWNAHSQWDLPFDNPFTPSNNSTVGETGPTYAGSMLRFPNQQSSFKVMYHHKQHANGSMETALEFSKSASLGLLKEKKTEQQTPY